MKNKIQQIQKLDKQINMHLRLEKSFNRLVIDICVIDNSSYLLGERGHKYILLFPRGTYFVSPNLRA